MVSVFSRPGRACDQKVVFTYRSIWIVTIMNAPCDMRRDCSRNSLCRFILTDDGSFDYISDLLR